MRLLLVLAAVFLLGLAPAPFPRAKKRPDAETLRRKLEGAWTVESCSVGGRLQGGPAPRWEKVRIASGTWSQTCKVQGRELQTTPYLITIDPKDVTRIDMAYRDARTPLLYGVFRLDGDRLVVTHATSGPRPSSHAAELRSGQVRWVLRRARD
jgi:uncharacterized protein (TIGR03067 family)